MKIPYTKIRSKNKPAARRENHIQQKSSRSVYNYRSVRNEANRPYNRGEEPGQKPTFWSRRYAKYAALAMALLSLVYLLTLQTSVDIELSGQSVISRPAKTYEMSINQYLTRSLFSYTKLTFNDDKLAAKITSQFPEVAEAKVTLPLFSRQPKVAIVFAEPSVILKAFGDDSYILGEQGRALIREAEASKSLSKKSLITVNDTSNQQIVVGQTILTQQQLDFIKQTVAHAKEKNLKVETVSLAGSVSQVNVKYSGLNYQVKYSFFSDSRLSSGAYFAIREQLKLENKTPNQYIDLRIPERAYIK